MLTLTIDGRQLQAEEGKTVLEVALDNNIYIPTLCHHEAVEPYGACRLCMVEITTKWGRNRLVTSCLYPAEEGLSVKTNTPRVANVRRTVIDLLLARCPDADAIQKLAKKIGVEKTSFPPEQDNKKCILCALCTRACHEVVGVSAISLANRGTEREMATPFYEFSEVCIACGSCAFICPTGAIELKDSGATRTITMPHVTMNFRLRKCKVCGMYWAPVRQLNYIIEKAGLPADAFDKCPDCRD